MKSTILFFLFVFVISNFLFSSTVVGLKVERPLDKVLYLTQFTNTEKLFQDKIEDICNKINIKLSKSGSKFKVTKEGIFNLIGTKVETDFDINYNVNIFKKKNSAESISMSMFITQNYPEKAFNFIKELIKPYFLRKNIKITITEKQISIPVYPKKKDSKKQLYISLKNSGILISTKPDRKVNCKFSSKNIVELFLDVKYFLMQFKKNISVELKKRKEPMSIDDFFSVIPKFRLFYYHTDKSYVISGRAKLNNKIAKIWKPFFLSKIFKLSQLPPAPKKSQIEIHNIIMFKSIYEFVVNNLKTSNPDAYKKFQLKQNIFKSKTGFSIEEGILSWLGNRVSFFVKDFGDLKNKVLPSVALLLESKNDEKMQSFFGQLISFFANKSNQLFYEKKYKDYGISSTKIPFFPGEFEPSFALIRGNFCIAFKPDILKEIIDGYETRKDINDTKEYFTYADINLSKIIPLAESYLVNFFVNRFYLCQNNKEKLQKAIKEYNEKNNSKFPVGKINILELRRKKVIGFLSKGPFCKYYYAKDGSVDCLVHKTGLKVDSFKKRGEQLFNKVKKLKFLKIDKTREIKKDFLYYDFKVELVR